MDTETHYLAEYQNEPGGTWYVAGDIYGYVAKYLADDAIDALRHKGKRVTNTRIWRVTTTVELL